MDGSRFDTWTRRKFGLAAGGAAVAGLLGLAGLDDADAARRRRGKRKPKRCRKLGDFCNDSIRRQNCCNPNYFCSTVKEFGPGNFCCIGVGGSCDTSSDCCGTEGCDVSTSQCRATK